MATKKKKRDHHAEMAGLAAVVRDVVDAAAREGIDVPADIVGALALVERWLAGDDVGDAAFGAARDKAFASGEAANRKAREIGGSEDWKLKANERESLLRVLRLSTAAGNLAEKARKQRGWEERATVVDPAMWSRGGDAEVELKRLEKVRAAAAKLGKSRPPSKSAAAPAREKPIAIDVTLLAKRVGKAAAQRLAKVCDHGAIASDADGLQAALHARGYDTSTQMLATLVAFDASYGGLEPYLDGEGQDPWLLGALACVTSDAHVKPTGGRVGLVPVAYAPNDVIYFLDATGEAWGQDTIEDTQAAPLSATGGDALIALIVVGKQKTGAATKKTKKKKRPARRK